ncbi:hypothetical protein D1007_35166 [Hordeum vulgare]|nr:hypothetical protein D1007_35166 [Hordeum vulgare]
MAAGIKNMQSRYNLKEQAAKEQCERADLAHKRLVCKGNEMQEWYNRPVNSLKRQDETLSMAKEDVAAWETRLAERKVRLDAKEAEISSREVALKLSLCNKEEELEVRLVQRAKELEDGHKVALATLSSTSAT